MMKVVKTANAFLFNKNGKDTIMMDADRITRYVVDTSVGIPNDTKSCCKILKTNWLKATIDSK